MKTRIRICIGLLVVIILIGIGWQFRTTAVLPRTGSDAVPPPLKRVRENVPVGKTSMPGALSQVARTYSRLPLHFEANQGQTDAQVNFFARGMGYTVFLTPTESVMVLNPAPDTRFRRAGASLNREETEHNRMPTVVRIKLEGANPKSQATGLNAASDRSNYFLGNDANKWRINVPRYGRVEYRGVYPGVDLAYHGDGGQLETDFTVAPGVDPRAIGMSVSGADHLEIDAQGDLVLHTSGGPIRQQKPVAYQDIDGMRRTVSCGYELGGDSHVGFRVGPYDTSSALVIDPIVGVYSTYLGGGARDQGLAVATDANGNTYLTGLTSSLDFPTVSPLQPSYGGDPWDAFVAKLNADGSALIYSTYLGGSNEDEGNAIAVDTDGNAYLTGSTGSLDFPTMNALQPTFGGGPRDAFVTKLSADGSTLIYSTYLGGSDFETGLGIVVDGGQNAYVTGTTTSMNFPLANPFQPMYGGGPYDGYVTKLSADGSALVYSTYLGGSDDDESEGIAVDANTNAYVIGLTVSANFPTANALQPANAGGPYDAFVTKFSADGSALVYSTYLGSSGDDEGADVVVDANGNAYITGLTNSPGFPTANAIQPTYGGGPYDVFVAKLSADGSGLIYSTFLGGSGDDEGLILAVDGAGNAYITGATSSAADFPLSNAFQPVYGGGLFDAFLTVLSSDGSAFLVSSYFGGSGADIGVGVAVDANGGVYVTGFTNSIDFPLLNAVQPGYGGGLRDAFVAKSVVMP